MNPATDPDDVPATALETASHYFSPTAADPDVITTLDVTLSGRAVQVRTAPGVFSQSRIDLGTRVLLRQAPAPPAQGTFLDLGCGWGPIALSLALHSPAAHVWAVDVNPRAVSLVTASARDIGLPGLRACLPDDVPDGLEFDVIWSNPPIRIGKQALHELLGGWLARLSAAGVAYLVVQRHLGADSLTAWIDAIDGLSARKVSSSKGFRVIEVSRSGSVTDHPSHAAHRR
ncbi:MAG: class I SAM-dependent methyltransferase [Actinomycetales bacterium]